jgi:hypothetical protein
MAQFVHEFGKRWDERVPRNAIRHHMGRIHVGVSDEAIAAEITAAVKRSKDADAFTPALVRQSIRFALICHTRNRDLFRRVQAGRL